jgi:DNA invertase Pin-like site-specific DNA recombinase
MGKFFFTILSGFAELEREFIRERSCLGQERARKEGKPIGKRGKDKGRRRISGYLLRWQKINNKVAVYK